jgi:dipeptidyl aminopeptidase/acylaminoacyl peptidase
VGGRRRRRERAVGAGQPRAHHLAGLVANGQQLAYVSFESRKPVVYVHDVASGQRRLIANFRGSNSAPAWSPDGRTLAVTLSRDGGSQLYTIDANGGEPRRLTQSSSIDTEPLYSADGRTHLFRERSRRRAADLPHGPGGGDPQRVTFTGHLQHLAGPQPRRPVAGLHFPHGRRLQAAGDGAGHGNVTPSPTRLPTRARASRPTAG